MNTAKNNGEMMPGNRTVRTLHWE